MSQVDDVRAVISDKPQYDRSVDTADGYSKDFELPNAPAVGSTVQVWKDGVLLTLTTDYTVAEALGVVSFVVAPGGGSLVEIAYQHTILTDGDITTFLALTANNTLLAAALALDAMASSEALVQKVMSIMGVSTNGAAVASALRDHAKELREQAATTAAETETGFEIAEQVYEPFGWTERIWKESERENA